MTTIIQSEAKSRRSRTSRSAHRAPRSFKPARGSRRGLLALAGGLAAFGLIAASAASLGTLTNKTVAASTGAVSACDTDGVTTTWTNVYYATGPFYRVDTVTISDINAACDTQQVRLTLAGAGDASLEEIVGIADASGSLTLTSVANVDAALVTRTAVVITSL
jgi:hypothetical protein